MFQCIWLTFFLFLLYSGQTDDTKAVSTPTTHEIRDKLTNPSKRSGNFDEQSASLEKRLRLGTNGTGALAAIRRKKQAEASLFTEDMFSNKVTRRTVAAKSTFNPQNAANIERQLRMAEVEVPEKPESDDPADLKAHIAVLEALTKKQKEVSIFVHSALRYPEWYLTMRCLCLLLHRRRWKNG